MRMKKEDIGKRVRVFDLPKGQGTGLVGIITDVYKYDSFRIMKENGKPSEFHKYTGDIQWLEVVE